MTIGEFSRQVGVTPSALRYYDDCGLLVPAETDPRTGYRFYAPGQQRHAVLLRLLRDAGLPLSDVRRVLAAPDDAAQVIADHGARIAADADAASAALRSAMRLLTGPGAHDTAVSVSGPQLASAVRQVTPAVDRSGTREVLAGVLVEIETDEVRLVASDRYRLAMRTLPVLRAVGRTVRMTVATAALQHLIPVLLRADVVDLRAGSAGLTCIVGDREHLLDGWNGEFPDYRTMLEQWVCADAKLVIDRTALLGSLEPALGDLVCIGPVDDATLRVAVREEVARTLPCAWIGPHFDTWFAAAHLAEALTASVGPDVIVELGADALPAVVRSADHGSFTTLVMPRRNAGPDSAEQEGNRLGSEQPGGAAVRAGDGG